jgi:hypothetical protein
MFKLVKRSGLGWQFSIGRSYNACVLSSHVGFIFSSFNGHGMILSESPINRHLSFCLFSLSRVCQWQVTVPLTTNTRMTTYRKKYIILFYFILFSEQIWLLFVVINNFFDLSICKINLKFIICLVWILCRN